MIRFSLLALLLALGVFAGPALSLAQTCTPACGTGSHCIYVGTTDSPNNPTTCVADQQNGTVDTVVVTGSGGSGMNFAQAVDSIVKFFDAYVIPFLYAIAFLVFLVGAFRFFFTGGEEGRQKARPFVFWGLVGLFIIFSVWGILNLLLSALPRA